MLEPKNVKVCKLKTISAPSPTLYLLMNHM